MYARFIYQSPYQERSHDNATIAIESNKGKAYIEFGSQRMVVRTAMVAERKTRTWKAQFRGL